MESVLESNSKIKNPARAENKTLLAGVLAGQAAGLIMAVVVMLVFAIFLGKSPLFPVQVIGSTVFGAAALQGTHFGAIIAGLLLHQLGPSLLWGIVFGLAASKLSISTAKQSLFLGIALALVSMVGPYVLISFLLKTLHGVDFWNQEVPLFWDWAAHLVFGASFVLFPKIREKINQS